MGTKRTADDVGQPWEQRAGAVYTVGARRSDTVRGWEAVESPPPVERDFLSHFTSGEGGKRKQCRIRRESLLSLPLGLCLGSQAQEEQQINREINDSIHGHHVPVVERNFLPQFTGREDGRGQTPRRSSPSLPLSLRLGSGEEKQNPEKRSRIGEPRCPAPHNRPPSAPPARHAPSTAPTPQRPPRAPAPACLNAATRQDGNVRDVGARLPRPEAARRSEESWRAAVGSERDPHIREAWLSQHGFLAGQAVQRFSAAMAAAASAAGMHMQWVSDDARLGCPACRCGPPTVVTAPRAHLCLCWDCTYIFRDDPAVACPVCAAVRAWGIRA